MNVIAGVVCICRWMALADSVIIEQLLVRRYFYALISGPRLTVRLLCVERSTEPATAQAWCLPGHVGGQVDLAPM